jgi:restriction endonuclease
MRLPERVHDCKRRSSGSDLIKLQEVGRGLHLPVYGITNHYINKGWYRK